MRKQMALLKRPFHRQRISKSDDNRYLLARDTESGRVFVIHEWASTVSDSLASEFAEIELEAFLAERGSAQEKLREMIGRLVREPSDTAAS
jgi:hypothetical protein